MRKACSAAPSEVSTITHGIYAYPVKQAPHGRGRRRRQARTRRATSGDVARIVRDLQFVVQQHVLALASEPVHALAPLADAVAQFGGAEEASRRLVEYSAEELMQLGEARPSETQTRRTDGVTRERWLFSPQHSAAGRRRTSARWRKCRRHQRGPAAARAGAGVRRLRAYVDRPAWGRDQARRARWPQARRAKLDLDEAVSHRRWGGCGTMRALRRHVLAPRMLTSWRSRCRGEAPAIRRRSAAGGEADVG